MDTSSIFRGAVERARWRRSPLDVPVVPDFDLRMELATRPDGALRMEVWHTCDTTHCRAGWAIVLAGAEGKALEERIGSRAAGALIYAKNSPGPIPDFYTSDEEARADIVRRAMASGIWRSAAVQLVASASSTATAPK